MLRTELQLAEGELKDKCWSPPVALQQWLQLTHEIENRAFIKKKITSEKQLQQAREAVSMIVNFNLLNINRTLSVRKIKEEKI